jgi:hypothetical protein
VKIQHNFSLCSKRRKGKTIVLGVWLAGIALVCLFEGFWVGLLGFFWG